MNKTHLAAIISGCFIFSRIASADPLVQFPTGDSDWTVSITYTKANTPPAQTGKKPAPRKVQKVEITQVGNVKRVQITWTDGQTTEEWAVPGLPVIFKEYPNGVVTSVQTGSLETKFESYNMPYDMSAFSWINPNCLQSQTPVNYQGKQCLYYKGLTDTPFTSGQKNTPVQAVREAWIDSKTLLPVVLNTGTALCIFAFQDPPPGPLVPPQKFKDGIAYYKKVMGFQ